MAEGLWTQNQSYEICHTSGGVQASNPQPVADHPVRSQAAADAGRHQRVVRRLLQRRRAGRGDAMGARQADLAADGEMLWQQVLRKRCQGGKQPGSGASQHTGGKRHNSGGHEGEQQVRPPPPPQGRRQVCCRSAGGARSPNKPARARGRRWEGWH